MSAKDEIPFQRDLNDELNKSKGFYKDIGDLQRENLFFARDFAEAAKDAAKAVYENSIAASATAKAFKDVASAAKDITDNYADVLTGEKAFQDLAKQELNLQKARNSFTTEYEQFLQTTIRDQDTINAILDGTVNVYDALDASVDDFTEDQFKLLELFENQNQELQSEAANMAEIAKRAKTIDNAMRPLGDNAITLGDGMRGITSGLKKGGLGDIADQLGVEDAITSTRKMAANLTEGGTKALDMSGKLKLSGNMAKMMGQNLLKAFGPISLIAIAVNEIINAFKVIDKASGETAKSMGISAEEARDMNAEMADAAAMSGDLLVSSQDVVKANMQLNKLMGTSVKFSGEFAAEFASIQERTGLSEKAMGVFAEKALIAGTSIEDQLQKVTAVTMEMSAQSGVMLNVKDIQEGIGEMSATQMLNNRMNTKEMAKQVFQAKLLGLSQSQLESVQGSLLEFESSIAAEMEAELLTGKQLNLEGARQAALMGDQAALAAELRKEVGTSAEFGKMNVIQQEAMAKAFGMSREDMAGMLIEQEKLEAVKAAGFASASEAQEMYNKALEDGNLTEAKKKKLQEAGLLAQFESATAQDKMNAAMDKFSDLFIQLVDPLMPLVDALMAVLDPIFAILSPILKLVGDIVSLTMATLMPALDAITGMLDGLADGFTDIFGGIGKVISGIINMDFSMMLEGFKSMAQGAIGLILLPFQAITDLVVGAINLVIDGLNYIPGVDISPLESPDLAGLVGGLVGLEEGGIVTKPTAALIGEGDEAEAVMPLSKLSSMIPGAAGGIFDAVTAPARGLASGIGSIAGGVSDFVGGLFGGGEAEVGNAEIIAELRAIKIAIEKGGDVYIDGAKAGKSMALATSKIG